RQRSRQLATLAIPTLYALNWQSCASFCIMSPIGCHNTLVCL
ncbi:hypothetical protein TNCV_2013101, partial [Trichonephila clavipes]